MTKKKARTFVGVKPTSVVRLQPVEQLAKTLELLHGELSKLMGLASRARYASRGALRKAKSSDVKWDVALWIGTIQQGRNRVKGAISDIECAIWWIQAGHISDNLHGLISNGCGDLL